MVHSKLGLLALCTLCLLISDDLLAARGGGGRGGGGRGGGGRGGGRARTPDSDQERPTIHWYESLDEALQAVAKGNLPVMVALTRFENKDDEKAIDKLDGWPQVVEASVDRMAAVEIDDEALAKEYLAKLNLKKVPCLVWLDKHGNGILGQSFPESAAALTDTVTRWKATITSVEKYFKDHATRGENFLKRCKLREAYLEFAFLVPFKGPEADAAREGQTKVKEQWTRLLEAAQKFPEGSPSRTSAVNGVRRDVYGLDCAKAYDEAIAGLDRKAAPPGKPADKENEAAGGRPAEPAKAASEPKLAMPAIENKPLAQLAAASSGPAVSADEDYSLDLRPLADTKDEKLKRAEKLIQEALGSYRKATADSMDRGQARNDLLADAHAKFDLALTALQESCGAQPEPQMRKLMERVSMLMYGCLKYRTL